MSERLQRNGWFAYFALTLFWGISAYAQIISYFRQGTLFLHYENKSLIVNDFVLWYNAALLAARAGSERLNVYDPAVQFVSLKALVLPHVLDVVRIVDYPPHFFALVRPLAPLGLGNSWIVWCLLALVPIVMALVQLSKHLQATLFTRVFFVVASLAAYPTWYAFELGQTTLFQFPALVAYWLLLRADRLFLAGLAAGLLTVKLQYAPCVVVVGLLLGRLRFLWGLLSCACALGAYTIYVVGWNNVIVYPKALLFAETSDQVAGVCAEVMQNFRGQFLALNLSGQIVHHLSAALFGIGILAVFLIWLLLHPRLSKAIGLRSFDICVSITTFVMLVCSPHTHFQDYMAIAIPVAFLYPLLKESAAKDRKLTALRVLLWGFPFFSWLSVVFLVPIVRLHIQPYFVWALGVIIIGSVKGLESLKSMGFCGMPDVQPSGELKPDG